MAIIKLEVSAENKERYLNALANELGMDIEGVIVYRNAEGRLDLGIYRPCGNCSLALQNPYSSNI